MDEHISRILKMLEEGKISATDAESLISALRAEAPAPPPPPPPPHAPQPPFSSQASQPSNGGPRASEEKTEGASGSDQAHSKSFEFSWSQKRSFPFDLSNLSKQISDAVKKIDPEKMVREARVGVSRGGKRWQDRMRHWSRFLDGEDGRPENTLGQPAARATENLIFDVSADASLHVDNPFGTISVLGGSEAVSIEIEKEAWASTEAEAAERLKEIKAEALTHQMPGIGAARLEVRASAPEEWRDGYLNMRLRVPEGISLRVQTVFGEIRVENIAGRVEVHTVSGGVTLENVRGEVEAEGITGDMRAIRIGGPLRLAAKSADIFVEELAQGGEITSISGDVRVKNVNGKRLEAKSVSGDVSVEEVGAVEGTDVTLESVSGDVRLTSSRGSVVLKTVSGDATAESLRTDSFQAQTVSGDLRVVLDTPFTGTITTNTVSGDVNIRTPESSSYRFTLGTQSGELSCGLTASAANHTSSLYTGTVGEGEGTITVQTRSGDVSLQRAE